MKVRLVGGPYDGRVMEVNTPSILIHDLNYVEGYCKYLVHKFKGQYDVFWIAGPEHWTVDDILEQLLYK